MTFILEDTIQEYRDIVAKINELRDLLSSKLIKLDAINSDGSMDVNNENIEHPSFSLLLTRANSEDIKSIINYHLPNKPIDNTRVFNTENDVIDYLYTDRTKTKTKIKDGTLTISEIHLLLLQKLMFYHKFLSYELENMGIPKSDIDNAKTLKNLILLLDRIDRMRETKIVYNDTNNNIYLNEDNNVPIKVYDKYDNILVPAGTIDIYENGIKINATPFDVNDDIIITPTSLGEHTYTIEYTPPDTDMNRYLPSTSTITLNVVYPSLDGTVLLHNITETSRFYDANSTDDEEGYKEDNWDINISIYNSRGQSINQPIPFDVYLQDDTLLFSGTTDSSGHAILHDVNIPYYTSDFIPVTIKYFEPLPTPIILSNEEVLRNLVFVKNLEVNDRQISYDVVQLYEDDFLDDVNGCVKDLTIDDNGDVHYTTYSTNNNMEIRNVPNIKEELEGLVTEILFDGVDIAYEVLGIKQYEVTNDIIANSLVLKVKTKINNPMYPDISIPHIVRLYHNPLLIDQGDLTWYITDPHAPTGATIQICSEDTGQPLRRLDISYNLVINNTNIVLTEPTYFFNYNNLTLDYGENNFDLILKTENNEYVSAIHSIITILSNFILPTQTEFFLNNTPEIYYKPLGQTTKNKQVTINYPTNSQVYYTSANGLIAQVQTWLTPQRYNLTLTAHSDDLTEQVTYSYLLKKPFTIDLVSYNQTSQIQYLITNLNTQYPCTYKVINNNNIVQSGTIAAGQSTQTITINKNNNNTGENTFIVSNNGYEEQRTFIFYDHIFELQTKEIYAGTNKQIQIKCLDPTITTLTISGTGITQTNVTKSGNIFTITCNAAQAFPNGLTLSITSGNITETDTLKILSNNIDATLTIGQDTFVNGSSTHNKILLTTNLPSNETITLTFFDGINYSTIQYTNNSSTHELFDFYQVDRTSGTYQASITFNGNTNYNSFTKTVSYTILPNDTYVADMNINNDGNLTITEIQRININNTNIGSNLDIDNNSDLLMLFEKFNNSTDIINNVIKSVTINNNGDLIINIDGTDWVKKDFTGIGNWVAFSGRVNTFTSNTDTTMTQRNGAKGGVHSSNTIFNLPNDDYEVFFAINDANIPIGVRIGLHSSSYTDHHEKAVIGLEKDTDGIFKFDHSTSSITTVTKVTTDLTSLSAGDIIRFVVIGNDVSMYINDTLYTTVTLDWLHTPIWLYAQSWSTNTGSFSIKNFRVRKI